MTYTLIMRLAGPMQSWGVSSRFSIRETLNEPSKSGVIGLLCAALGWDRMAQEHPIAGKKRNLAELACMPFGVRVVQEGVVRRDFHTAQNVLRAKANLRPGRPVAGGDLQETVLSERYYLSDAHFLVGLESDDHALLLALDQALAQPHWPLCLGRKAFIPSYPVRYTTQSLSGVVALPLAEALFASKEIPESRRRPENQSFRYVTDCTTPPIIPNLTFTPLRRVQRTDVPLSFHPRRFAPREVIIYTYVSDQTHSESTQQSSAS